MIFRPARDVELPNMRLPQRLLAFVGAEPDDQGVLPDPDEHVAVQVESDAAEHLLLLDAFLAGQGVTDARGE